MSQQLDLSDETLQKLHSIADAKGVTPEAWIEAQVLEARAVEVRGESQEGIDSLTRGEGSGRAFGKYAHVPGTSEDFAREKQAEIDREDRRFR